MNRRLVFLSFLVLLVVTNLPCTYEVLDSDHVGTEIELLPSQQIASQTSHVFAGWPCKYYLKVENPGDKPITSFNWLPLFLNIAFWVTAAVTLEVYERRIARRKALVAASDAEQLFDQGERQPIDRSVPIRRKARSLQLSDILVATACAAAFFAYWQAIKSRSDSEKKLAEEIANNGGGVTFTAMLPTFGKSLPADYSRFLRASEVRLLNPDDTTLEKVVALPYLKRLNIVEGSYDFKAVEQLAKNPLLEELSIVGRPLNADAIGALRSIRTLKRLNLMRTNITAAGVNAIGQPNLRELNLIHTDIRLDEIGTPIFAQTIRKLSLPHSGNLNNDSLSLENWPDLRELSCFEYDEHMNSETLSITLKNLPNLETVKFDGLKKLDLNFEQLPKLSKMEIALHQWEQRTTTKQVVPNCCWIRKLRMTDVPNLRILDLFVADMESFSIEQASIILGLSAFNMAFDRDRSANSFQVVPRGGNEEYLEPGCLSEKDIPLPVRQTWIDDFGKSTGLVSIDLDSVPLKGLSLKPLVANKSVRRLALGRSGLMSTQLKDLEGMEKLEELSLVAVTIDGREIEWLTKTFPKLRKLECKNYAVETLRLENIPNLESVFELASKDQNGQSVFSYTIGASPLNALKIVDAPKLKDKFVTSYPLRHLQIEAAPALTGLSFQSPLPDNAVIKGVRDLKFFAAGGANCTDVIVSEVLSNCKQLNRLTLAYANLSPETLKKISQLQLLECLVLTGTNIGDQVVAEFAGLGLKVLRLDHTAISQESVKVISKLTSLEVLDLGELKLNSSEVSQLLTNLTYLRQISLVGAELSIENMQQLNKLNLLLELDLSQCLLSDELLNALAESVPPNLAVIKFNSSQLGKTGFQNLVRRAARTQFALNDTEVSPNLMDQLVGTDRVVDLEDSNSVPKIFISGRNFQVDSMRPQIGDINVSRFAPNYQDPRAGFRKNFKEVRDSNQIEEYAAPQSIFEKLGFELFNILN